MKVRDIMTEPPLTCTPETSLAVAARLMGEADYGTLPVIDSRGQLAGIITDRDICLALASTNRNALHVAVHEVMTRKVFSALIDDDVRSALATMKGAVVRRLPVRDEFGRLKGMLSIEDIVVRGLEGNGIATDEIVAALRAMYTRVPVKVEPSPTPNEFTPG
jgi:IMP dehydrogenase